MIGFNARRAGLRVGSSLLLAVALAGCGNKGEGQVKALAMKEMKPLEAALRQEATAQAVSPNRYLAYEHSLTIDVPAQQVPTVFEAAQAACREAVADVCAVLHSNVTTGRHAGASLKFRAKPAGIRKLIATLGKQGEIVSQSTSAEDLAGPIADTDKQLAMLNDYRTKLEALRGRAASDVDALIKVNRELAQVQSQLEAATGSRAHLMQRVDTEILNVSIISYQNLSFWRPISLAAGDFGGNLAQGISSTITGIAFLIPWVLLLSLAVWVGRVLWRWRKRRAQG